MINTNVTPQQPISEGFFSFNVNGSSISFTNKSVPASIHAITKYDLLTGNSSCDITFLKDVLQVAIPIITDVQRIN